MVENKIQTLIFLVNEKVNDQLALAKYQRLANKAGEYSQISSTKKPPRMPFGELAGYWAESV